MEVLNEPFSRPTFDCTRGQSWIDLILAKTENFVPVDFEVVDVETLSDHKYIRIDLMLEFVGTRFHDRRKIEFKNIDLDNVRLQFLEVIEEYDIEDFDEFNVELRLEAIVDRVILCCQQNKIKRKLIERKKNTPWWSMGYSSPKIKSSSYSKKGSEKFIM